MGKPKLQRVTMNFSGLTRMDQMEGKDFIVAPMVMLTEGVHAGSQGPLYYPPEELAKTPVVWNQKPVVVYHPEKDGQGVSACDPVILSTRKVGVIMNAHYADGKLKAEAWLEADRINKVDERIATAIENNEMMELSTGVFTDAVEEAGEWNGEAYTHIARNYRPDHLALLPDKIGACAIADGAGFLRNEKGKTKSKTDAYGEMFKGYLNRNFARAMDRTNAAFNELSHSNIRSALGMQIRERFGEDNFIEEVFDNFVVFEDFKDGKLFQIGYNAVNDVLELSDKQPLEVVRITEFKTVGGTPLLGNAKIGKELGMERKDAVETLIKNGEWDEADRKFLMDMEDGRFKKITKNAEEKPAAKTEEKETKKDEEPKAETVKENDKPIPAQNAEEYINNAPADIRDMLRAGISAHNSEKAKLVGVIKANEKNIFTDEALNAKGLAELKAIACMAATVETKTNTINYGGMADVIPAANAAVEEPLGIPTMNFEKK